MTPRRTTLFASATGQVTGHIAIVPGSMPRKSPRWPRPLWQPAPSIGQCSHAFLAPVSDPAGMRGQQRSVYRPPHCPSCALTHICRHLVRLRRGWAFVWHNSLCVWKPWQRERWSALTASLFLITKAIDCSRAPKRCRTASGRRLQLQSSISD